MAQAPRARWPGIRVLAAGLILLFAAWQMLHSPTKESTWQLASANPLAEGTFDCVRVIDGDTLDIRVAQATSTEKGEQHSTIWRVRLLGINAPEDTTKHEPFGPEATAYLREAVEGKPVQLKWDKRRIDRYGRRLAYVYRDELFVNHELLLLGLARGFDYPGDNSSLAREFRKAEQEAREQGRGIWSLPQKDRTVAANSR